MEWPYRFIFGQSPDELAQRRYLLDYYARLAQYSVLVPLFLIYSVRYLQQQAIAGSKENSRQKDGLFTWVTGVWSLSTWVSDEEIAPGWGTWRQVGFAAVWASWLAWCVVRGTGDGELEIFCLTVGLG